MNEIILYNGWIWSRIFHNSQIHMVYKSFDDTDENLEFDDLQFLTLSLLKLRILKARATVIDKTLEMTKQ